MRLCEDLDEVQWQRAFGAYVTVNKSHWTGPPFDIVERILASKGTYEFCVKSMGTWMSKFVLEKRDDGFYVEFGINPEVQGRMRERLERMHEEFSGIVARSHP